MFHDMFGNELCVKCGQKISGVDRFCRHCGTASLAATSRPDPATVASNRPHENRPPTIIFLVGLIMICLGALRLVVGVLALHLSAIAGLLVLAFGLSVIRLRKIALGRAWPITGVLAVGLTPLGLVLSLGLVAFTRFIRRRPELFS